MRLVPTAPSRVVASATAVTSSPPRAGHVVDRRSRSDSEKVSGPQAPLTGGCTWPAHSGRPPFPAASPPVAPGLDETSGKSGCSAVTIENTAQAKILETFFLMEEKRAIRTQKFQDLCHDQ
jgi:hypothetical protein